MSEQECVNALKAIQNALLFFLDGEDNDPSKLENLQLVFEKQNTKEETNFKEFIYLFTKIID